MGSRWVPGGFPVGWLLSGSCESLDGSPDVGYGEAFGKGVGGVEDVAGEACDPGLACEGGDYRVVWADFCFGDQAAGECGAEDAFVDVILVERELPFGVEYGHAGTGAGTAGGSVEAA